ncbi:Dyp-type peroxidase [Streptomyces sp. NPDC098789]|uniref:Dyp-type peroxidase n=1 Tax=Streptomyces sp. NPDC098789 TaxID=3366098 RepID=UPI00380AF899
MSTQSDNSFPVMRRSLLGALPSLAVLSACGPGTTTPAAPAPAPAPGSGPGPVPAAADPHRAAVPAAGPRQAGIDRPAQPQQHTVVSVFDIGPRVDVAELAAHLGEAVLGLCGKARAALGADAGDLTVTVGVGPGPSGTATARAVGGLELPAFAREERSAGSWGGDLLVQTCASDPVAAVLADTRLAADLAARGASRRWSQAGFRPPGGGAVRNLLGFPDGIENPRTDAELSREVWLPGPGPVAGATVAVVRRLRIDAPAFLAQSVARQEEAIGRRRTDGSPLSGGGPSDPLDLSAKSARGRYLVPAMAHARRANPNATGSAKMLRRGYSYRNGPEDQGLLFVSFQRRLRTFTATQRRLDDGDDLMRFVTATASAAFLVLPGFSAEVPLGGTLLGERS